MEIATNDMDVERRINDFLWGGSNHIGKTLDNLLKGPFSRFSRCAIVGGMVRDIARGDDFNSDIDIVIDGTTQDVADVARSLGARINAFGGWTTRHCNADIDFWALESTWALRTGLVEGRSLEIFPKTTFFTHDSAFFDLNDRRVVSDGMFWNAIRRREIEINLEPTPLPDGNLYRAVKRILNWDLNVGPRLSRFIELHLNVGSFQRLVEMELRKQHPALIANFSSHEALKAEIIKYNTNIETCSLGKYREA
jgi:hypothetical protein